jgi:hypothetical protein
MSNDNEQIIEDVEEKDLVVESEVEVSEETEVTEQEQPLSDTVLEVLLGEAKKKNEAEESEEDEEVSEEEDEDEELEEAKVSEEDEEESDEDEEEVSEAKEDDESDEDEEEVSEAKEEEEEVEEEESDEDEEEVSESAEDEEESDEVEEEEESDEDEEEVELPEVKTKAGILAASFDALKGMKKSNLVAAYEAINMTEEEEDEVEVPKTKADIINAMYGQLKAMKKDDIMASYKSIMASYNSAKNEETEADSFASDLKVLAEADQGLTEDFKAKASILFEAAVADKVNSIQEELESQYTEDLQEEVTYVRESLVEKIDDYLSFVVESWIEENQEFVDNKLRTEITENFMTALQGVFTEHYIEVPASKVDLVDELSEEVAEVKESLANAEAEKSELASQVVTLQREKIISEASTDLASTEAGKLSSLVEDTEFVDADTFSAKVATIKEGFFKESKQSEELVESQDSTVTETQTIVEGAVDPQAKLPKDMAKYVQHLSRFK